MNSTTIIAGLTPCRLWSWSATTAMPLRVVGYNAVALPIAAGSSNLSSGWSCRPEIAALSMSGFGFLVAVNALML